MKPLIFAPAALNDLNDIADYIDEDNPTRALTFVAELEAKAAKLPNDRFPFLHETT